MILSSPNPCVFESRRIKLRMVWKLFYDGGCNLCHVSKLRAERWAERAGQPMEVDILQSHYAIEQGYGDAMVLEADRVYQGAEAWMKIMTISPWYLRWLGWLGQFWPFHPILKWGYGVVAKYRYRWFGTRACPIPGAKTR